MMKPMSVQAGTKLGPYEVLAAIGAGGMGEVYRARDSRLDREVAIKILPDVFAHDAERVARFTPARVERLLLHDRLRFAITVSGVAFAVTLVLVQGPAEAGDGLDPERYVGIAW